MRDSKSLEHYARAGSSPARGTMRIQNLMVIRLEVKTARGGLQTRTFGLARGGSSPSDPSMRGIFERQLEYSYDDSSL